MKWWEDEEDVHFVALFDFFFPNIKKIIRSIVLFIS